MSKFTMTTYTMPAASLGKDNPLPDLKSVADPHAKIEIDETTVSAEEARYMGWGRIHTILPYTIQDGYNRSRRARAFKAAVLENEHLRATFLPQLGGRLWSLFDKDTGRELLHVNPVFQPCNLALRNAWFSGGVEWNLGIIGHTPFTVDDMACQQLALSDGTPVLRMFQYERVRHLFYRVEAFLPDGAKELYVRVRIDNATMEDTAVYWWSNMAVNEGEDVRVVVPAAKAFRYGYGGKLAKVPIPYMTAEADKLRGEAARLARANGGTLDWDVTRTTTLPQAMDFFFDVPPNVRPFIAAPGADGYGMCQTSTGELRGRKLFVWGMGTGGRHWQSFLAREGCAYIELQAGLAHTQLEHLPMKGGETISWLESYGPVSADPKKVHGTDWDAAVDAVAQALEKSRPAATLELLHARVQEELDGLNGRVLHKGMGFARAEKLLLGDSFSSAGLSLEAMRLGKPEAPWIALAKTGVFPCPDPLDEPLSYQIGRAWEASLSNSIQSGRSDHWYAHYQLGVLRAARGDDASARASFERSLDLARNPWALRCLALLSQRAGNAALAADLLCEAVSMKPIRPLAIEALDALAKAGAYERMTLLAATLPENVRTLGRVKTYEILALLRTGRCDEAQALLESRIVLTDVREGDVLLTDLWFELMARRERGNADAASIAWAHEHLKPPKHLDFRMS
jgi:hypothetical protein